MILVKMYYSNYIYSQTATTETHHSVYALHKFIENIVFTLTVENAVDFSVTYRWF